MVYYENSNHTFEKGDNALVVNCGNPDLEIEDGKQVIPVSKASERGITHFGGTPIEELVTPQGTLR